MFNFISSETLNSLLHPFRKIGFFTLFILIFIFKSQATHIKAGEITITNGAGSTIFDITLTLYLDSTSITTHSELEEETALIDFGDNTDLVIPRLSRVYIGNNTYKMTYKVTHDFKVLGGQPYIISYTRSNRNKYIVNISGKSGLNSDEVPFYIESALFTDPFIGSVTSPILENPPIDNATPDQIFTHNPGAIPGSKGDSISYEMVVPKKSNFLNVPQYVNPADSDFEGKSIDDTPANLTLNANTGDLIWNTPSNYFPSGIDFALYNVAIKITQWRKRNDGSTVPISYVVRDMQIQVKKIRNKRPELMIPNDTCIIAGNIFKDTVYASDPDRPKQLIILTSRSELLSLPPAININPTFTLNNPVNLNRNIINNPGTGTITWTPSCRDVRDQPYYMVFEAQDNVGYNLRLATYKTMTINVDGPQPKSFNVTPLVRSFKLSWDLYTCASNGADSIMIFRKDCNLDSFKIDDCKPLSLLNQGYKKIGSISAKSTSYIDNFKIADGSNYCYIIVARFPGRGGRTEYASGLSIPSKEICVSTFYESSVISSVNVIKTDSTSGAIQVKWINGPAFKNKNNYTIKIFRGIGIKSTSYQEIFSTNNSVDSIFTDFSGQLNTRDTSYNYYLEYSKNNIKLANSDTASSVYLNLSTNDTNTDLFWSYNVPWDNSIYKHFVYKKTKKDSTFVLKDSIQPTSKNITNYTDRDLVLNDSVCYFVVTKGKYCNDTLPPILQSKSEIKCRVGSTHPCPPILSLLDENCNIDKDSFLAKPYKNYLSWIIIDTVCLKELKNYNLYFAPQEDKPFQLLNTFSKDSLAFIHEDYTSQAGCYKVTSVANNGEESQSSNIECNDNCFNYELPNLVTPNNDKKNDVFAPLNYPKGVDKVELFVYNRWGSLVHYQNGDIFINWNPKLSDGIYYYTANLKYERRLSEKKTHTQLKGWLEILGSETSIKKIN